MACARWKHSRFRKTKKFTMKLVGTMGRGIAWSTIGTLVLKGVSFASIFVILSSLSVYQYGLAELALSVVSILGIFMVPGLTQTVIADLMVERARGNGGSMKHLFLAYSKLNIALGVIAWAVTFFGASIISSLIGNEYTSHLLKIVSFLFLTSPLRAATTTLATINLRFLDQSFYPVIEEGIKFLAVLMLLVWFGLGPEGLLYATVLAELVTSIAFLPRSFSAWKIFSGAKASGGPAFWRLLSDHRKWGVGASYVNTLSNNLRLWIIKLFLGTEAVGLYAFARGLYAHISGLSPLPGVVSPILPRYIDRLSEFVRLLRASMKLQLALSSTFLLGAMLTGPLFIHFIFPQYEPAIPILLVLLFALPPNAILAVLTPVFSTFKRQRSFFWANVFKMCIMVISLPILASLFGALGVAAELVLTSSASAIERYVRVRQLFPQHSLDFKNIFYLDADERGVAVFLYEKIRNRIRQGLKFIWFKKAA